MPTSYVTALLVLVAIIGMTRVLLPALPARRASVRLNTAEIVLSVLAVLALGLHCGAMFYRSNIQSLPGAANAVSEIDALGATSIIAFAVPAILLIVALRRIYGPALALLTIALAAVGTTMYDQGPLNVHLTAIFVTVALLALCGAALIGGQRINHPTPGSTS